MVYFLDCFTFNHLLHTVLHTLSSELSEKLQEFEKYLEDLIGLKPVFVLFFNERTTELKVNI